MWMKLSSAEVSIIMSDGSAVLLETSIGCLDRGGQHVGEKWHVDCACQSLKVSSISGSLPPAQHERSQSGKRSKEQRRLEENLLKGSSWFVVPPNS